MKSETLVFDCRNAMLEAVKAHSTWGGLTEQQQRDIVDNLQSSSEAIVAEACRLIGERQGAGHRFSRKGVSQTATGSITLKLETAFEHEIWSELGESSVLLVVPIDPKNHDQPEQPEDRYNQVQPDQPQMFKESATTDHGAAEPEQPEPKAEAPKKISAKSPPDLPGEAEADAPKKGRGRPPKKKADKDQPIAVLVQQGELTKSGIKAVAQLANSYIKAKGLDPESGRDLKMAIADVMADDPLYRPVIDAGNVPEYEIIEEMDIPQSDDGPAPTPEEAFADEDAFGG